MIDSTQEKSMKAFWIFKNDYTDSSQLSLNYDPSPWYFVHDKSTFHFAVPNKSPDRLIMMANQFNNQKSTIVNKIKH